MGKAPAAMGTPWLQLPARPGSSGGPLGESDARFAPARWIETSAKLNSPHLASAAGTRLTWETLGAKLELKVKRSSQACWLNSRAEPKGLFLFGWCFKYV